MLLNLRRLMARMLFNFVLIDRILTANIYDVESVKESLSVVGWSSSDSCIDPGLADFGDKVCCSESKDAVDVVS